MHSHHTHQCTTPHKNLFFTAFAENFVRVRIAIFFDEIAFYTIWLLHYYKQRNRIQNNNSINHLTISFFLPSGTKIRTKTTVLIVEHLNLITGSQQLYPISYFFTFVSCFLSIHVSWAKCNVEICVVHAWMEDMKWFNFKCDHPIINWFTRFEWSSSYHIYYAIKCVYERHFFLSVIVVFILCLVAVDFAYAKHEWQNDTYVWTHTLIRDISWWGRYV